MSVKRVKVKLIFVAFCVMIMPMRSFACQAAFEYYLRKDFAAAIKSRANIGPEIYVEYSMADFSQLPEQHRDVGLSGVRSDEIHSHIMLPSRNAKLKANDGHVYGIQDFKFFEHRGLILDGEGKRVRFSKREMATLPVSNYGVASIVDSKLIVKPFDPYTFGLLDFFRMEHLDRLSNTYDVKSHLPKAAWMDLTLQEYGLSSARKWELAIVRGSRLSSYLRIYVGNKNLGQEKDVFGLSEPKTQIFFEGMHIGDYPTYYMPLERTVKRRADDSNPIAAYRNNPAFKDFLFIELGRLFFNPENTVEEIEEDKKILYSTAINTIKQIVPDEDLSRVLIFANGSPAGARLYQHDHGFMPIEGGRMTPDMLQSIHDTTLQQGPFMLNLKFSQKLDPDVLLPERENIRDIIILGSTGDRWYNFLNTKGYIVSNGGRPGWTWLPKPVEFLQGVFLRPGLGI